MTRATLIPLTPEQRAQIAENVKRARELYAAQYARRPTPKVAQSAPSDADRKDPVK